MFARYDGKPMELWRLDLSSGREQALTSAGAVNVEPRLSPDGSRLAWVSTEGTGHFNLFVADIDASGLHNARPLLGERKSAIDRYYYSTFDHAVNPSWSPDGATIFFVSNPEIAWGTGDVWSVPRTRPGQAHADTQRGNVLERASGNRARRQAPALQQLPRATGHQLWLSTVDGAAPLPLTFGDFDRRNARWSPDGRRIAYIGNEHGNTELVRAWTSSAAPAGR